jgi:hypothetical protein
MCPHSKTPAAGVTVAGLWCSGHEGEIPSPSSEAGTPANCDSSLPNRRFDARLSDKHLAISRRADYHKTAASTRQLDGFPCYSAPASGRGFSLWFWRPTREARSRGGGGSGQANAGARRGRVPTPSLVHVPPQRAGAVRLHF